jgi:hypothetical protein
MAIPRRHWFSIEFALTIKPFDEASSAPARSTATGRAAHGPPHCGCPFACRLLADPPRQRSGLVGSFVRSLLACTSRRMAWMSAFW